MRHSQDSRSTSKPSRKRSLQACLACRSRKVRCDVSSHGQPCTNCTLDEKQCLLPKGATAWNQVAFGKQPSQQTCNSIVSGTGEPRPRETDVRSPLNSISIPEITGSDGLLQPTNTADARQAWHMDSLDFNTITGVATIGNFENSTPNEQQSHGGSLENIFSKDVGALSPTRPMTFALDNSSKRTEEVVLYSCYRFLTVDNLFAIPQQDVNYLEAQGCLHIPTRPILGVFMRQYFTNVHLFLPLIDEGEFWDMYSQNHNSAPKTTMSLLVLQAMLFASCNSVPPAVLNRLGYSDTCIARAELYRKTKLLYDLETESGHVPLAQSALLLMGWVPNSPANTSPNPWKTWLSLALHHSKHANAHRYGKSDGAPTSASPAQKQSCRTFRRLWWCCIILDRLSPLCTRFRLQITSDIFDLEGCVPLGASDLQSEIHRSKVFLPATKRRHIVLFSKFLDLLMVLTEVLPIVFPFETSFKPSPDPANESEAKILHKCRGLLRDWYETVSVEFPPFDGQDRDQTPDPADPTNSIIKYTNLMYIYYYTSCITLCNSRIFNQLSGSVWPNLRPTIDDGASEGVETRRDMEFSTVRLTQCVGALTRYHLLSDLPITTLACIATPLALYVVTARLSSLRQELTLDHLDKQSDPNLASNQSQIAILLEAMDAFLPQYYGIDWVKETAKHAADLAQTYSQNLSQSGHETMQNWGQILVTHPKAYLRLIWTVDLCISRGRLPGNQDFPSCLRDGFDNTKRILMGTKDRTSSYRSLGGSMVADDTSDYDLEQLLGLADPSMELSWDDVALFHETIFDEGATGTGI